MLFKKKQSTTNQKKEVTQLEPNFDNYNSSWDRELNDIRVNSREGGTKSKRFSTLINANEFEAIAREEDQKFINEEIYSENNFEFINNIKNQIYAETYRLLGNDQASPASHEELAELDEKYKTGNEYDDSMINIASSNDKELLKLFDEEAKANYVARERKSYDENFEGSLDEYNAQQRHINHINNQDFESKLSEADKAKIKAYTHYAENINESIVQPNEVKANAAEWKAYRDDIANYSKTKSAQEVPNYKVEETFIKNNITHAEGFMEPKQDPEIKWAPQEDKLLKTNDTTRPSIKEQAPYVPTANRVTDVKKLEDTDWEKIKDYVKDFNTNVNTVAIANVPTIVDADNALKVDLDAKFYLSQEQLKQLRDKQAKEFQSVIDDYEETLKKHEEQALQKIYDSINAKPEVKVDKTETKQKQEEQNSQNLKVIDENLKLKKQIKELEEKLNKPAPVPVVAPKLAKFELEDQIEVIEPQPVKETPKVVAPTKVEESKPTTSTEEKPVEATEAKKIQPAKKIVLKSLAPNNGPKNSLPSKNSNFMSMNHPASAMSQRNEPTSSLVKGNAEKSDIFANTLAKNRMASVGPAQHNNNDLFAGGNDETFKININQVKKQALEDTQMVGPDDEINKIVSLKDALRNK